MIVREKGKLIPPGIFLLCFLGSRPTQSGTALIRQLSVPIGSEYPPVFPAILWNTFPSTTTLVVFMMGVPESNGNSNNEKAVLSKPDFNSPKLGDSAGRRLMATIEDDDERLLARIGYRQVRDSTATKAASVLNCY